MRTVVYTLYWSYWDCWSVGGEHYLAVSGVLQLVRQSDHLQPHFQGLPRRLSRHLLVPSSFRHHRTHRRCRRRWSQRPRRAAAVGKGGDWGRSRRHHADELGGPTAAAAAAAKSRRWRRQFVRLFKQSPPWRLTWNKNDAEVRLYD